MDENWQQDGSSMDDGRRKAHLGSLGTPAQSKVARLRVLFDVIEGALKRGAFRQQVLDALNEEGFGLTMASFKSALQRIREKRRGCSPITRDVSICGAVLPERSTSCKQVDGMWSPVDKQLPECGVAFEPAQDIAMPEESFVDVFARRRSLRWDGRR